jgi:branched-chain amino acid transport system substrate-binding protein
MGNWDFKDVERWAFTRRKFLKTLALTGAVSSVDLFGPFKNMGFGKEKPIKIGVCNALSGSLTTLGTWGLWGSMLAVNRWNQAGGHNGRPIEQITEDDEAKVPTAIRKVRKLVLQDEVDCLQGLTSSAVCLGTMPTARELKTLLLVGTCMAAEVTNEKADRYTFRPYDNAILKDISIAPFLVKNVAKKWFSVYIDYAWGQSHNKEFKKYLEKAGGEIVGSLGVPSGTVDMLPYLSKVDPKAEGVYMTFAGNEAILAVKQAYELGLAKKFKMAGPGATVSESELSAQGESANDFFFADRYVGELEKDFNTPFNKRFQEDFLKVSKGEPANRYSLCDFEGINFLKLAMKKANYQDKKKDTPKLIEALEGMQVTESDDFPQGTKFMRAEDHQVFCRMIIGQVQKKVRRILEVVPMEKVIYPPVIDVRKQPF